MNMPGINSEYIKNCRYVQCVSALAVTRFSHGDGSEDAKIERVIPKTTTFFSIIEIFTDAAEEVLFRIKAIHQLLKEVYFRVSVVPFQRIPQIDFISRISIRVMLFWVGEHIDNILITN